MTNSLEPSPHGYQIPKSANGRKRSTEHLSHFCHWSQSYGIYAIRAAAGCLPRLRTATHAASVGYLTPHWRAKSGPLRLLDS